MAHLIVTVSVIYQKVHILLKVSLRLYFQKEKIFEVIEFSSWSSVRRLSESIVGWLGTHSWLG